MNIHIVDARRSPIGRFGGGLKDVPAAELAKQIATAILPKVLMPHIQQVIMGQVLQAGCGMNIARQVALDLGLPQSATAFTVNMVCGSGLKAVALGMAEIAQGNADLVLAGGAENMSLAPHLSNKMRFGAKLGDAAFIDSILTDGLTDPTLKIGMGETAENIAHSTGISREEQDEFAAASQAKWAIVGEGWRRENVPIQASRAVIGSDEHPRPDTTVEKLAALRPAFRANGTVTAGNSSGINDGAAMMLLASDQAIAGYSLATRARIVGFAATGCDPAQMGLGPISAIQTLCKKIGWKLEDVPAVEINEAFAVQALACIRHLKLDPTRVNQRGGAIAMGHPIGCSGARVLVSLLHLMEDANYQRGIASLCVGGGMGVAMAIERG